MEHRYLITLSLLALAVTVRAQHSELKSQTVTTDSIQEDFEEWLRHESKPSELDKPLAPHSDNKLFTRPLPPSTGIIDPRLLAKKEQPPVSVVVMTPKLRTDMQLAYQSHWLEEQRKEQKGGAMMVGVNPLCLIAFTISKLFPSLSNSKSKKERQREHLRQVLEHY